MTTPDIEGEAFPQNTSSLVTWADGSRINLEYYYLKQITQVDLYAKWSALDELDIITIYYKAGGLQDDVVARGQPVTLPSPAARDGYTFLGWQASRNRRIYSEPLWDYHDGWKQWQGEGGLKLYAPGSQFVITD